MQKHQYWKRVASQLHENERVLIATSGGVDSMALLHLVVPEDPAQRERVVVANVHHGTGDFADRSMELVRREAGKLGVHFVCERVAISEDERAEYGFEAVARWKRYNALERIGQQWCCGLLLTAHTLDDQSETMLMALMRGCGLGGLSGIREHRGRWWRPLLHIRRCELEEFIRKDSIPTIEDPANVDCAYTRVRVRRELTPQILERFGEGAWRNIAKSAKFLAEADRVLHLQALEALQQATIGSISGWIAVDAARLVGYFETDTVQRALTLAVAFSAKVPHDEIYLSERTRRWLMRLLKDRESGEKLALPGVDVVRSKERLVFNGHAQASPTDWDMKASITLADGGRICAEPVVLNEDGERPRSERGILETLDAEKVGVKVTVRPWQPGDRYKPLGRNGDEDKVVRALSYPPGRRIGPLWVMENQSGEIIWVLGERIADTCKIHAKTRHAWSFHYFKPESIDPANVL